jgi:acetylornithine deacetylase/succinyl-diaminopimelate desuccinylase-like protein
LTAGASDILDRAILAAAGEAEELLAELVRTPTDNPPGDLAAAAERYAGLLEGFGFAVERHPVPDELVRAHGMISCTNLLVRRRFGSGPVLALNAHGDVVPPGGGWSVDPYGAAIRDGWMYGRGVAVSKSDIASYALALRGLGAIAGELRGAVELHVTFDEEAGGEIGPAFLLEQEVTRPDFAICAGFSYRVVHAHNGCLHLEVEVRGRSAHAALPATGVDALEAAAAALSALYDHRRELATRVSAIPGIGSPQLTVGLIRGGINTNVVPDRVVFRLDRRIVPEEDPGRVQEQLETLIRDAVRRVPGAEVSFRCVMVAEPLRPTPASEALARRVARHAGEVLGEPVPVEGVPLYTDARHYAAAGIPVVLYGAGPRTLEEANAHRADERLPLALLPVAARVVARTARELLSGA